MDGHQWEQVAESEIRATGRKTKKQWLWHCSRCHTSTIVDDGVQPEATRELYHLDPIEFAGTTIMDPLVESCDVEIVSKIMNS